MSTIMEFQSALDELNTRFPRPGLMLKTSQKFDIHTEFNRQFPGSDSPGVYALIANDGLEVLRVGMAQVLGNRLGQNYFGWDDWEQGRGKAKNPSYEGVRYIVTIQLPQDRAWEAGSIEAFLLGKLRPPLNVRLGLLDE
jgi:excinuclease UvrABC nuclease subunit